MMSVAQAAASAAHSQFAARRMSGRNCLSGGVEVEVAGGATVRRSRRRRAAVSTGAVMATSDASGLDTAKVEDKWIAGSVDRCAVGA